MIIKNTDMKPSDYQFRNIPRPGHADFTYLEKYGVCSDSGGGRASARETGARVAAGAICLEYLETLGINIIAWISSIENITINDINATYTREEVERNGCISLENENILTRCPEKETALQIYQLIKSVKEEGDSLGGIISCCISGIDQRIMQFLQGKISSILGYSVLSIPSVKGFRLLEYKERIRFQVAFKPVSTIKLPQYTCDWKGSQQILENKGRHDPCVLPRAVPIVESMAGIAILDTLLSYKTII